MKKMNVLRMIGLIVVITMLAMAVPVTAATRFIELDPEEGTIGSKVTVVGEGFNESTDTTDKYAVMYFSSEEASSVDDIDSDVTVYEIVKDGIWLDEDGEFDVEFTVPSKLNDGEDDDDYEDVTSGTYYVYVCHYLNTVPPSIATRIRAVAEFTIIGGEINIDPEEGPVGTEIEISGAEFIDNEDITVYYDDDEIDIESGDDETDKDGDFECTVLIPESTVDTHTIKIEVGDSEAEAEFTVESELVLDLTSGEAGEEISVSGTGFDRRSDVVVYFDAEEIIADTTDSDGSFEQTFTVPELEAGIYDVEAEDEDGNLDTAKFTIMVSGSTEPSPTSPTDPTPAPSPTAINISNESGKIGSDIVITGVGFAAGVVTIKFGDEVLDTAVADASGIFVAIVKVPSSKAGDHTITVSDGTNTNEVTFTVEAVPPPIPAPLLPEMGVEAKTPVTFDWEDVTADAEPVSYALQIATDDDFAEDSIVLEETGLDESEYTTTEAESLALASREAAYYWRVRSIDAAETEGEWTGAGEFYVSKSFSFPTWALYTLIVIGGLVLFAGGYLMGRRTAYYYTL